MDVVFISLPYIYPLCPLNLNHSKMFVVADVYARYYAKKKENPFIIFPVASHFSGNTAQSTAKFIDEYFTDKKNENNIKIFNLHRTFYRTPCNVIKEFVNPYYLMNYYHNEILWELKNLSVSCDYSNAYTTQDPMFTFFVRVLVDKYKQHNLLVVNNNGDLAVNYNDTIWRKETFELINRTNILQNFQKKVILSAFENLSSDWEMLRTTGYGVEYDSGMIVDPMFDSELFMIFDLFVFWRNYYGVSICNEYVFFNCLFESLKANKIFASNLSRDEVLVIEGILKSLPCNMFFAEEHLKNWICKKFFAEQCMLSPDLHTKEYRILGMGMLDKKRMSASRGHAILTKDLIRDYGGVISRLVLLLSGGNISKHYNYEINLPNIAKKMLEQFIEYWLFLKSDYVAANTVVSVETYSKNIDALINDGYIRKAITELLVNIPNNNKRPDVNSKKALICFYNSYLPIFLPGLVLC